MTLFAKRSSAWRLRSAVASCFLAAAVSSSEANSGAVAVRPGVPTKVLGTPVTSSLSNRTALAYAAAGSYAKVSGEVCFALVGGRCSSSATVPGSNYVDRADGTVVWRPVLSRSRTALGVFNVSEAGTVWVNALGRPAVTNACIPVLPGGSLRIIGTSEVPQGEVFVIPEAGRTNQVIAVEW